MPRITLTERKLSDLIFHEANSPYVGYDRNDLTEAISVMGQKSHDTDKIISRYKKEVVTELMASQLILGQEGGGSYSLAESLDSVTKMVVDARLNQIKEQLNHDLIPQLFELNGWDVTETPQFEYGRIS